MSRNHIWQRRTRWWWLVNGIALLAMPTTALIRASEPAGQKTQPGPLDPAAALKSFQLHSLFKIDQVASEPLVQDPVAIAFDAHGQLYVAEYPEFNQYRFPASKRRMGRVKLLRDTDGDGRFDRASVFVEVPFATGVIAFRGGVLVAAAPDLLFCRDRDGDGVADEKRAVLTGFGRDFAGGGIFNSLRWGLDNRVHMATGFAGGAVHRPDLHAETAISIRQRGLILDPQTMAFAATSGGGQFGLSIDDAGNKFLCSNVRPLQFLSYDDRYSQRNPFFAPPPPAIDINAEPALARLHRISPLEPWRVQRSAAAESQRPDDLEAARSGGVFTSASGITVYRGDAFPATFYGNLFVGEVANNLVYRARLEETKFGWRAHRADENAEFLASRDPWFRPVQFANGPDGALYVVDMYRELIEGAAFVPESSLREIDPSRGTARGRIYRILPRSTPANPLPSLADQTTAQLVTSLSHRNAWHRETAARLLVERQDRAALPLLDRLAQQAHHPTTRLHALYGLQSQQSLSDSRLRTALHDSDPRVRKHALILSEPRLDASFEFREIIRKMTRDPSPRVRLQLGFSLATAPVEVRFTSLRELLLRDPSEALLAAAVQSSLRRGAGTMLSQLIRDPQALANSKLQALMQRLAVQIGVQGESNEVATALAALSQLESSQEPLSRHLQQSLFTNLPAQRLAEIDRGNGIAKLLEDLVQTAERTADNPREALNRRLEAVRTLGIGTLTEGRKLAVFKNLLRYDQPATIQATAAATLARFKSERVSELLLNAWPQMTPRVRRTAVETLFARPPWRRAFLEAVEAGVVAASEVDPARVRLLLTRSQPPLTERLERLFSHHRLEGRQEVINRYQAALRSRGNATDGKRIFERRCSSCHRFQGQGTAVGPDLDTLGNRPAAALLIDILDPSRNMKPLFQSYLVQTVQGQVITGMVVNETANSLEVHQTDGSRRAILRIDIESMQSTGVSFMADGLEKQIDVPAMADLLALLRS